MKTVVIIIPCYNEEESIPYLIIKLTELEKLLSGKYSFSFLFVDDGSQDATYNLLKSSTVRLPNVQIISHKTNRNLGAALKTGIEKAPESDYLAFLDSDCTYEPFILLALLQELDKGSDLSNVSPYHPDGFVDGVPAWRLVLSRGLNLIYQKILPSEFYTYTAMVRAVRREKVNALINERDDFSFVALFFIKAIRLKYQISEVPATLHNRKFGVSKMGVYRTIRSHLQILFSILKGDL